MKLFALILGPDGLGLISQFSNFQVFLSGIICIGIPVGLTTIVAQRYQKDNYDEVKSLILLLVIALFVFSSVVTLTLILFSKPISYYLVNDKSSYLIMIIVSLATPFIIQYNLMEAYLKGTGKINLIIKINLLNSLFSLIIVIPLVYFYSIYGAAVFFLISGVLPLFFFFILGNINLKKVFSLKLEINKILLIRILKIGIVALASSFLFQLSMIQLRKFIIDNYGIQSAGIYQSVLGLSTNYFVIIYSVLSLYLLPQLSKIESNSEITKELNNNLRFLLLLIIPMSIILLTFKDEFLKLFYSSEFLKASDYFYYQIFGDVFRALAALFGLWLIPKFKIVALLSIDLSLNALLLTLPFLSLLVFKKDLILIPIIYLVSFFVHFALYFIYTKIKLRFKLEKRTIKSIVIALSICLVSVLINAYMVDYSKILIIPILIVSTYFIFNKEEKRKLFDFVSVMFNKSNK